MNKNQSENDKLKKLDVSHLIHPNTNLKDHEQVGPLIISSGAGSTVFDLDGKDYIDSLGGLWNCSLGHGRKDVIDAVSEQMEKIAYVTTFQGVSNDTTIKWAAALARHLPGELRHVFPNVTGSEANDTAFKFARMYFSLRGKPTKIKIFSHSRGYHGVALGVLGATGLTDFWKRYMPLPAHFVHIPAPHCYRCPYGEKYPGCELLCARVMEQMIVAEEPDTVSVFIAEPVIGGGGIVIPPPEYYGRVREVTGKYDILFISDEVITGFGRTGKWFGIEHWNVVPDLMTMGKGMTAGYLPMFATAVSDRVYRQLADSGEVLFHGFTYTGHPATSAAALKVIQVLEDENLVEHVNQVGGLLNERLQTLLDYPWVGDVRSIGLLAGIEFVADKQTKEAFPAEKKFAVKMVNALRKNGVIGRVVKGDTLVMAPPFTITVDELDTMFKRICASIEEVCRSM